VIDNLIEGLLNHEIKKNWKPPLQFPFCPRQLLLNKTLPVVANTISFAERYNTHVTRSLRSLVQEIWGEQGLLWGDFQCKDENCGVKFYNTRLDGKCLRCGSTVRYIEKLIVDDSVGFSGHCHAIVYSSELKGYVVFDVTTRNSNIIEKVTVPYSDVYLKTTLISVFLSSRVPIVGRAILWLGKPKPKPYRLWFYEGMGEGVVEELLKINSELEHKNITDLPLYCSSPEDAAARSCPFVDKCFGCAVTAT